MEIVPIQPIDYQLIAQILLLTFITCTLLMYKRSIYKIWKHVTNKLPAFRFYDNIKHTPMSTLTYNSYTDPYYLLLHNDNLVNISINTNDIRLSYECCIEACLNQIHLRTLNLITSKEIRRAIQSQTVLDSLKYIQIIVNSDTNSNNDHLNPILQSARNAETIIYENGLLTENSMFILIKLKKLKLLILDDIRIANYKAYSIMLFNLRVRTLITRLKHPFIDE